MRYSSSGLWIAVPGLAFGGAMIAMSVLLFFGVDAGFPERPYEIVLQTIGRIVVGSVLGWFMFAFSLSAGLKSLRADVMAVLGPSGVRLIPLIGQVRTFRWEEIGFVDFGYRNLVVETKPDEAGRKRRGAVPFSLSDQTEDALARAFGHYRPDLVYPPDDAPWPYTSAEHAKRDSDGRIVIDPRRWTGGGARLPR
jgi:hypothetical protein